MRARAIKPDLTRRQLWGRTVAMVLIVMATFGVWGTLTAGKHDELVQQRREAKCLLLQERGLELPPFCKGLVP